ncbi:MAG: V-type ATP synthase subunit F [Clostridia bacterium]|nr:V-type ATP synthase subunit F [Clostridia bacterium]
MKMYLLSADADTLTGMRLAGIDGEIISCKEELEAAAKKAEEEKEIAVLLVAETLAEKYEAELTELKKKGKVLITQIPDMQWLERKNKKP